MYFSFICDDDDAEASGIGKGTTSIDGKNYSKYIREIFKYNPERYKNMNDEDDINMEASYKDIMKEEFQR